MTTSKTGRKLEKGLKKAASAIGKTLAKSQGKTEKAGRRTAKSAEKLVKGIAHSAKEVLAKTASKLKQTEEKISSDLERGSTRFKSGGQKSVAEAVSILAVEIRSFMEEHEEIGASRLLGLMKGQGNSEAMVFAAIGWLLKEKKIVISSDGKKISLE